MWTGAILNSGGKKSRVVRFSTVDHISLVFQGDIGPKILLPHRAFLNIGSEIRMTNTTILLLNNWNNRIHKMEDKISVML